MFPVLIRIGPLTIHTYGLLIATGFLVALFLASREAKRKDIPNEGIVDVGFYALFAGLIGSRLFFIATNWQHYSEHPIDMVKIWEGGLVFYGGVLFAVPTVIWYAKKKALPLWQAADIWAPSIAIGHAIGRLGCFCAGCCYGKPAEGLPWAVTFTNPDSLAIVGTPLHPTQLYESAAELLNFLILITLRRHQTFKGQLFWMYILNYSIIRSVVEIFRGDEVRGFLFPGFSYSQAISVTMFVTALSFLLVLKGKKNL
ncbi:MAG: prolipoprotein diacylglyceryl transferase [Nitrospirae bacterium]|jgi:phosphatidylglycerol:prolipoprotein diacylglycerol transferase|nr:prolipoprotein diacylglyceryl transferase [Nitrospirota bacterium]